MIAAAAVEKLITSGQESIQLSNTRLEMAPSRWGFNVRRTQA
jgi:hypothetical protein